MSGDLSAAPFVPVKPVPPPDIIPLLPRGDTVFEDLPVRALVLEALAPAIGDGLIVVRRSPGVGVLLIRAGRIGDIHAVEPEQRVSGDAAMARIAGWDDAIVSAWRLAANVIDVLPPLVRGNQLYADLRLEWVIWNRLLADLRSRRGTYIVEISTAAGRGVTSIRDGVQVATYTDRHRELGDPSLVDELAAAGSGAVRVLQDGAGGGAASEVAPAASVHESYAASPAVHEPFVASPGVRPASPVVHPVLPVAEPGGVPAIQRADDEERFTNVYGIAQTPRGVPDLVPIGGGAGGDVTVAQLLPLLKRMVRDRLHQSSLRLEILLEDAAANNASLDAVVAEVRATPIRGVMQSTLDDLADEMLALGQR